MEKQSESSENKQTNKIPRNHAALGIDGGKHLFQKLHPQNKGFSPSEKKKKKMEKEKKKKRKYDATSQVNVKELSRTIGRLFSECLTKGQTT